VVESGRSAAERRHLRRELGCLGAVAVLHEADSVGVKLNRAEYVFELHGDIASATAVMRRALEDSTSSADQAFAHYVGELAFNAGNPSAALAETKPVRRPTPATQRFGRARPERRWRSG
jgi:Flp pilus assembly protein TadD